MPSECPPPSIGGGLFILFNLSNSSASSSAIVWIAALALTTMERASAFPRRDLRPGDASSVSLLKEEGAGNAGRSTAPAILVG